MYISAFHRPENIIKLFIKKKANLNLKNKDGNSALIFSLIYNRKINIIKLLINEKTDLNQKNKKGNSPFLFFHRFGK